jgi:hypothetical protein
MDVMAELDTPCPPSELYGWVDDLGRYPAWLEMVRRAEPARPEPDDPGPVWIVDLRGRLGPLARTKRLRMARSEAEPPTQVVFERREVDGRSHSAWVLRAEVTPMGNGSRLTMRLHYGGSLWGPVLERMLRDEIERSRPRLLALTSGAG